MKSIWRKKYVIPNLCGREEGEIESEAANLERDQSI